MTVVANYAEQVQRAAGLLAQMRKRTEALAADLREKGFYAEFDVEGTLVIKIPPAE